MTELFLKVFNLSVSAGWFVLAVLVLRLLLRKAPKWTAPALWGLVGVRLLLPFSIESPFSLVPSAETVSPEIMMAPRPAIDSGIPIIDQAVDPVLAGSFAPGPGASVNPLQVWLFLAAVVWLIGAAVMLCWALASYLRLKKQVGTAVRLRDNIFQSENVPSPFVLGVVRPRIYLPFAIPRENMDHVIAHEEAHLARRDHWWKPLGFLLLAVHWFNPLMWVAYILLCRDIELACDERVIEALEPGPRADYSQALLDCGVKRRLVTACPLAFGEVGVKERVKQVLSYKKPAFWLTAVAVAACAVAAVCFLTDPVRYDEKLQVGGQVYVWDGSTVEELPAGSQALGTLQSIAHRTKEPPERDFSAVNLDAKYAGNALYRSGADPDTVLLEDLKGFYLAFLRETAGDGPAGELTMDLLREIVEKDDWEGVDLAAYSNGVRDDLGTALNYYLSFPLEDQGKSYRLDVSRMKDDNSLAFVELSKLSNGEILWLYNANYEDLVDRDLDGFLAHDYDIRDEVSWTTPAGLTETEYRGDYGTAGGVLLEPDAYEVLGDPKKRSSPPEWSAAGMVAQYYTDVVEWNGAEIGMVYGLGNHTDPEPLGPVDGLCAPAYLFRTEHDLYTVNDLAQLEEQGVDTESLETTSAYWYIWFARPGEEQGVVVSLNTKNFTREDALEFAKSVRY